MGVRRKSKTTTTTTQRVTTTMPRTPATITRIMAWARTTSTRVFVLRHSLQRYPGATPGRENSSMQRGQNSTYIRLRRTVRTLVPSGRVGRMGTTPKRAPSRRRWADGGRPGQGRAKASTMATTTTTMRTATTTTTRHKSGQDFNNGPIREVFKVFYAPLRVYRVFIF